jgi:uncharacterized damage-inducible protein DinB
MAGIYRQGALGALLDAYEKALAELKQCIQYVSDEELVRIANHETTDQNCKSIQTVLTHVVMAMRIYAGYIAGLYGEQADRPAKLLRSSVQQYYTDIDEAFRFVEEVVKDVKNNELTSQEKKITTHWGQAFDIEQMLEHSIVHVLRHCRQLERYKEELRAVN